MRMGRRFTPTFAYLLSAMIVWAVFFMGSYGLVSLFCAIRPSPAIAGIPAAPVALGLMTFMALAATSFLVFTAWRHRSDNQDDRFIAGLVLLQGGIAAVAILWNLLPLAFLEGCGWQELVRL